MSSLTSAIGAVLIAMISIQTGAALAKQLFPILGAQGVTAFRLPIAALLLCAVFRPWKRKLTKRNWMAIAIYGLFLGSMNFLFYLALERIPLGIAVALEFTGPLCVSLFSSRKPMDFVWALLAIAGIALIFPITEASGPIDLTGAALALGAGACWAGYIVFGARAGASLHSGTVSSLGMLVGSILVLPFGIAHAGSKMLDPSLLPMAAAVGVLSSALPYSLEMFALKRLPAKNFGILMSIEPAIASLSGLIFLSELLTATQWAAIACIIVASIGSSATAEPIAADVP